MRLPQLFSIRGVAFVIGALIVSVAAYGFAASNTVPETGAGDGQGQISGYTIENVSYQLNDTNPAEIDAVSFDLSASAGAPLPGDVRVQLEDPDGQWFTCSTEDEAMPANFSCELDPAVLVADANQLRVVAAQTVVTP